MPETTESKIRTEGFRKAEASLKLEGIDPSGTPLYESIKIRIISGELSYAQGRAEILAYYSHADSAEPVTAAECPQKRV